MTVMSFLVVSSCFAMAMSASDDKKDDRKDKEKHQPVVIVIYLPPWSPVVREASLQTIVENNEIVVDYTTTL